MNEQQIRNHVAEAARAWLGAQQGDARHKQIIDIYNAARPLPRYYAVTYTDAWCATFVSTVAIELGYTDIIPTECSCWYMVELFRKHPYSRWQEDESIMPQIGDIAFYNWADGTNYETTDNTGEPNHVGIVVDINGNEFTVVEGNYSKSVKERVLQRNGRYLRGFGQPAYHLKVDKEDITVGQAEELRALIEAQSRLIAAQSKRIEELESRVLPIYKTIDGEHGVPIWNDGESRRAVIDAIERGVLLGVQSDDLGLSYDNLRTLVWAYRERKREAG